MGKNEKKYYVYFHRNPVTDKIFYVGMGYGFRAFYFKETTRGKHWNCYIKSHGLPKVEIYKEGLTREDAIKIEIELIAKYGRKNIDNNGILVNLTLGGDGGNGLIGSLNHNYGKKLSPEQRKKLSIAHSGKKLSQEHKKNISQAHKERGNKPSREAILKSTQHRKINGGLKKEKHPLYGKPRTDECKRKISDGNRGKVVSSESRKKMSKTHLALKQFAKKIRHNESGVVFNSMIEAADNFNITNKVLWNWLNKVPSKKHIFSYA